MDETRQRTTDASSLRLGLIPWPRIYITVAGVLGVATGFLGFTDNPFVGDPANDSIFTTDALHNGIHVATGLLALWIGLGTTGVNQARGIAWFGVLYIVIFAVLLASPTLFGMLDVSVNSADHVLHAGLGPTTLVVGLVALRLASASP